MTKLSSISGLLAICLVAAVMPARADERVDVKVDEARVVTMPDNVKTMILGNPGIADITLLKKGGAVIITGKSFGQTNLITLDGDGKLVFETTIRVSAPGGKLTIYAGADRQSYSCNPRCETTISLGDSLKFMSDNIGAAAAHAGAAQPGGGGAAAK